MAYSTIVVPGDGVTTQIPVNFALGFINAATDITCRVGTEVDGSGNPAYRTLGWLSSTLVQVGGAPAAIGQNYVFTRTVTKTALIVDWEDGEGITGPNLNTAQEQAIMIGHEALDQGYRAIKAPIGEQGRDIIGPFVTGDLLMVAADGSIKSGGQITDVLNITNFYTKTQANATFYNKTDSDANLATNFYTRTQTNAAFYSKTQIDALNYTKAQIDTLLTAFYDNNPTLVSAAYTVTGTDHANTMLCGGSLYAVTFAAIGDVPSAYRTNFFVDITNESLTRGKRINVASQSPFILWPGQTVRVKRGTTDWVVVGRKQRFKLGDVGGLSRFYVDPANGTSNGEGLVDGLATSGAGCFKSVTDAFTNLVRNVDCNNVMPYIRVISSITGEIFIPSFAGQLMGSCQVTLEGDVTGVAPIRWVANANNQAFIQCRDNAIVTVNGFDFDHGTFISGVCLNPSQGGTIDYINCWFGPCIQGDHIRIDAGGSANCLDTSTGCKIYGLGSAASNGVHVHMTGSGGAWNAGGATFLVPNGMQFAYWIYVQGPSMANISFCAFSGTGAGAGSIGTKYLITLNGVVISGGTTWPGNTVGSVNTGGIYT